MGKKIVCDQERPQRHYSVFSNMITSHNFIGLEAKIWSALLLVSSSSSPTLHIQVRFLEILKFRDRLLFAKLPRSDMICARVMAFDPICNANLFASDLSI